LSQPTRRFGDRPRNAGRQNVNSFLIDFHVVYAVLIVYLMMKRAGYAFGPDGWREPTCGAKQRPAALGGRLRRDD
jgi:hypothetical protein